MFIALQLQTYCVALVLIVEDGQGHSVTTIVWQNNGIQMRFAQTIRSLHIAQYVMVVLDHVITAVECSKLK